MCIAVFVAVGRPLELRPFVASRPGFYVRAVTEEAEGIRRYFSLPLVYEVGANSGCGCGFYLAAEDLDVQEDPAVPEMVKQGVRADYAERRESVAALRGLLEEAISGGGFAEVYVCWQGQWDAEPVSRRECGLGHFGGIEFRFREREFIVVREMLGAG